VRKREKQREGDVMGFKKRGADTLTPALSLRERGK